MSEAPDQDRLHSDEIDETPFLSATDEAHRALGRFNLAIIGATGVGKSSLVNAVFGRDLARVGRGLPVTRGAHYYNDDVLGIWDLEGFEIGTDRTPADSLRDNLKHISARPAVEQISVVWYCVSSTADRLTEREIEMIAALGAAGLPVILVLTKVDWAKNVLTGSRTAPQNVVEFAAWLASPVDHHDNPLTIPVRDIVLTSTQTKDGKGSGHGLGELVTSTLALSPNGEKDAFRVAQRLNLPWKREVARPYIAAAAASAAAAAAIPIPVADAVALAPIQMAMMGKIAVVYDLEVKTMLSASALAQIGAQITGQAMARSLLKFIPGAGSVIGASVAFALTAAMGEGWLRLCEKVHIGEIDADQIEEQWRAYVPSVLDVVQQLIRARN